MSAFVFVFFDGFLFFLRGSALFISANFSIFSRLCFPRPNFWKLILICKFTAVDSYETGHNLPDYLKRQPSASSKLHFQQFHCIPRDTSPQSCAKEHKSSLHQAWRRSVEGLLSVFVAFTYPLVLRSSGSIDVQVVFDIMSKRESGPVILFLKYIFRTLLSIFQKNYSLHRTFQKTNFEMHSFLTNWIQIFLDPSLVFRTKKPCI